MMEYIEITEQDFTLHRNGKPILVGHPDSVRVYEQRRIVAVMERKFGFKPVQSADANFQLRCYLVLAANEFPPADLYYGCLTQPRISSKPQIVRYTPADIAAAKQEIFDIYDACFAPEALRKASNEACEHCTGKPNCPEFRDWSMAVTEAMHLPVSQWPDEGMDLFMSRVGILEKFLKDTKEQIKLIKLANPERLPGWKLKPGAEVRHVSDLVAAWSALQAHMSAREFSEACSASIGELEKILWQRSQGDTVRGRLSQKQAKALLNDLLKGLIELKRNKPSLEKE